MNTIVLETKKVSEIMVISLSLLIKEDIDGGKKLQSF